MSDDAPDNKEAFLLRLANLRTQNDTLKEQNAALQQQLAAAENDAASGADWRKRYDEERAARKADADRYQTSIAMGRYGITDDSDQDLARWAWDRLGDDRKRFGTLADWLAHDDGARTHKHLSGFFNPAEAASVDAAAAPKRTNEIPDAGAMPPPKPQSQETRKAAYYEALSRYTTEKSPEARASLRDAAIAAGIDVAGWL